MTSPVAAFLDSLVGGVERGTAFRQQRDDRRLVLSEHADDRQYEQARRLREGVAAGLEGKILQYQADHLGEPSPVRLNPGETYYDPRGGHEPYTAPDRERAPSGSDFELIVAPDGTVQRVPKMGAPGVVPGVRGRVPRDGSDPSLHPRLGSQEHRKAWVAERAQKLYDGSRGYADSTPISMEAARDQAETQYDAAYGPPPSHAPSPGHVTGHPGRLGIPSPPQSGGFPGGTYQARPKGADGDSVATQQAAWDRAAQHIKATRPGTDPASVLGPRP